jgi:hypothetical protein
VHTICHILTFSFRFLFPSVFAETAVCSHLNQTSLLFTASLLPLPNAGSISLSKYQGMPPFHCVLRRTNNRLLAILSLNNQRQPDVMLFAEAATLWSIDHCTILFGANDTTVSNSDFPDDWVCAGPDVVLISEYLHFQVLMYDSCPKTTGKRWLIHTLTARLRLLTVRCVSAVLFQLSKSGCFHARKSTAISSLTPFSVCVSLTFFFSLSDHTLEWKKGD